MMRRIICLPLLFILFVSCEDPDKDIGMHSILIDDIDPGKATVYGVVSCDGAGIAGVSVSDGMEVAVTDRDGVFRLRSQKELGYVFVSVPGGYEVATKGILPRFHNTLVADKRTPERSDFALTKVSNDKFTLIVMGDMHLANRNNDRTEFYKFTEDVRSYMAAHPRDKIYGLTLGDMTWDLYWYSKSYCFPQYLDDMNHASTGVDKLMVWHTIGNHDHDMDAAGDFDTEVEYVKDIAPTYYSFNLGKVHFIVLDDILCKNSGTGDRKYDEKLDAAQSSWLKKDLANVPKTTPIVVTMHAPAYHDNASNSSVTPELASNFKSFFNYFNGYPVVHLITGHTHRVLNVDNTESSNFFEHNAGAVCATWWWTQAYNKVNVGTDGAPGGYELWEVDGTSFKWQFRATKEDPSFQFRSYDLNNVCFDATTVVSYLPGGSAWAREEFARRYGARFPKSSSNKVLLNVWGYDPKWTIKVTEKAGSGDKALTVKRIKTYDPLHIIAMSAVRFNSPDLSASNTPDFTSSLTTHMFEVQASSPSTTLEIEVRDEFGNVSRETMARPKAFTIDNYKTNYSNTY